MQKGPISLTKKPKRAPSLGSRACEINRRAVGRDRLEQRELGLTWILLTVVLYTTKRLVRALYCRLYYLLMAKEDWLDVLGLYKWKIRERTWDLLGEGMEDNYNSLVSRIYPPSCYQVPL